jgi:hypothetical protein
MIAPGTRLTAAPPALTSFLGCDGGLRIRRTGKTLGGEVREVVRDALGLLGLGCDIGLRLLVRQLGGMYHDKPDLLPGNVLVTIFHFDAAADTPPTPAPWRLVCSPSRFFKEQR